MKPVLHSSVFGSRIDGESAAKDRYAPAMRHHPLTWRRRLIGGGLLLVGACLLVSIAKGQPVVSPVLQVVTNVLQIEQLGAHGQTITCQAHLQGTIAWASTSGQSLVLNDSSGAALISIQPPDQNLLPGQLVSVEGEGSGSAAGGCCQIGSLLVVDNNGVHGLQEKAGTVSLKAGRHPFALTWFTRDTPPALTVYYQGPNLPRQKTPASAWSRPTRDPSGNAVGWATGLDFQTFTGDWWQLPPFQNYTPVKSGITPDVDLGVRTQDTNVAIRFSGCLEIPRDGAYTFSTVSDGGSQLHLQLLRLNVVGEGAAPEPRRLAIGQRLSEHEDSQWASIEGVVTFVGQTQTPGLELELTSPTGTIRVELADASGILPGLLLHSRVQALGISRTTRTSDGHIILGALWVPAPQLLQVLEPASTFWSSQPVTDLHQLLTTHSLTPSLPPVHVRGQARPAGDSLVMLDDGTGQVPLLSPPPPGAANSFLEVLATPQWSGTNLVLRVIFCQALKGAPTNAATLPTLTTVEEIKRLKRTEALRGYPVHVSGTITWSAGSAVVIQDSTAGIFVSEVPVADADGPRKGEAWEIEGITYAQFSPMILARRVVRRGLGILPQPLHPTWDQLINGSLDTQYVEVRGSVIDLQSNTVTLLTPGGLIRLDLPEKRPEDLKPLDGTLLRVRGCLWAKKDDTTHEIKIGEVEIHSPALQVDQAAPADPFAAPCKHPADLLLFDAQAATFQPVKVAGQIVHARAGEFRLMDGEEGLRFEPKNPLPLQPGDLVEVVGFPELGGPSPLLRQARVHALGHAALPEPKRLSEEALFTGHHDATLVQVEAQLVKLSGDQKDQVLSLQLGSHSFVARLNAKPDSVQSLRLGSRLQLTGVYAGRGAWDDINSFELWLNFPSDIRVIAQPPWWTLRRLLAMVGVLLAVLGMAAVWIGLLRRQVEQRSVQLRDEIHVREQAEHQRAVEAERSRIARDLHDDLGSSLTEISLLADAGPGWPPTLDRADQRFKTIADKARAIVNALDVIVWLVNPRQDALPFLAGYLASYTEEYLSASGLACRLKIPLAMPSVRMTAEVRHSLFLAVKESLRNVVRHAHASEVVMELTVAPHQLEIVIADDGQGFDGPANPAGNGLANLRDRLAGVGGHCEITSRPGAGTRVSMALPLPKNSTDL